ncbi:MAG: hypothetical protein KatS3mg027_0027 [Bacteroidia bacterium]|nr:MAG: hypothetical protein KatS3mg027_0027 [Bacteroidia bacterium]
MSAKKKRAAKRKPAEGTTQPKEKAAARSGGKKPAGKRQSRNMYKKIEEQLLKRREELLQQIYGEVGALQRDSLSPTGDQADQAATAIQEDLYSQLAEMEGHELMQIDYALQRIREGTYGICEECGKEIPLGRLQVMPYTTLCVECQAQQEEEYGEGYVYTGRDAWSRAVDMESLTAEEEEEITSEKRPSPIEEEEEEEEDLDSIAVEGEEEEAEEEEEEV